MAQTEETELALFGHEHEISLPRTLQQRHTEELNRRRVYLHTAPKLIPREPRPLITMPKVNDQPSMMHLAEQAGINVRDPSAVQDWLNQSMPTRRKI